MNYRLFFKTTSNFFAKIYKKCNAYQKKIIPLRENRPSNLGEIEFKKY